MARDFAFVRFQHHADFDRLLHKNPRIRLSGQVPRLDRARRQGPIRKNYMARSGHTQQTMTHRDMGRDDPHGEREGSLVLSRLLWML